jgi:hypothetical protein
VVIEVVIDFDSTRTRIITVVPDITRGGKELFKEDLAAKMFSPSHAA